MKVFEDKIQKKYDIAIFPLGYESRAVSIAKKTSAEEAYCIGYNYNHIYKYNYNETYYSGKGYNIYENVDDLISALKRSKALHKESPKILIDISSMARTNLAKIIWFLLRSCCKRNVIITIAYTISKYIHPPKVASPIKTIGPISDSIPTKLGDIGKDTTCIVGLGYEQHKAYGAVSSIQPNEIWALIPKGKDNRFLSDVLSNNKGLLEEVDERKVLQYEVDRPIETYRYLRTLVFSLKKYSKPIIMPLGPKILCAISVIIAFEMKGEIPIWRVSSEELEEPSDRKASTDVIYSISFE